MTEPVRLAVVPPPVPNDPRMEFMFGALDGLPPARQKRLILEARQPHVGILSDELAATMIDALGLKGA